MARGAKSKSRSVDAIEIDDARAASEAEIEGEVEGEEEQGDEGGDDDDENEDEGEYEVEAILDHKQRSGKFIYLVSWRGYGPEHNTWEPEEHVSHAELAVSKYWDSRPKTTIKKAAETTSKRGRPSASTSQRPSKAAKANGGAGGRRKAIDVEELDEEEDDYQPHEVTHVDSTDKYQDIEDWEDLVQSVDTIERGPKESLVVYLTMIGGEKIAQDPQVVYRRCPQKILKFYEAHLKWRA